MHRHTNTCMYKISIHILSTVQMDSSSFTLYIMYFLLLWFRTNQISTSLTIFISHSIRQPSKQPSLSMLYIYPLDLFTRKTRFNSSSEFYLLSQLLLLYVAATVTITVTSMEGFHLIMQY